MNRQLPLSYISWSTTLYLQDWHCQEYQQKVLGHLVALIKAAIHTKDPLWDPQRFPMMVAWQNDTSPILSAPAASHKNLSDFIRTLMVSRRHCFETKIQSGVAGKEFSIWQDLWRKRNFVSCIS